MLSTLRERLLCSPSPAFSDDVEFRELGVAVEDTGVEVWDGSGDGVCIVPVEGVAVSGAGM